jgi:hypothetical protein
MKNWWLYLSFGFFFAVNAFAATYDATGNWDWTDSNHWNNCGDPNPGTEQGTDTIVQKGDSFTLITSGLGTLTGSVSGPTYTAVTVFFEDGGQTTLTFSITASSNTQADGDVSWTWSGFGETCSGGWTTSFSRQPQSPPIYDASGSWEYTSFNHWNTCGDPNAQPSPELITMSQNGNRVSVVDAAQQLYDGFIDGAVYNFVRSYPEDGGTTSEIYTVPLNTGGTSGDGSGSWVWNDAYSVCNGGFDFTIEKQAHAARHGEIVVDFGAIGLWARMNDATWLKLNNSSPDQVVVGDMDGNGADDVIAYFSGFGGIFVKRNLGGWSQFSTLIPEVMAVGDLDANGKDDVVIDFGGIGLWARMNDASWLQLHNGSPELIATGDVDGNGADDVLASFSGLGFWQKLNLGGWTALSNSAPDQVVTGDVNASGKDDIIADFGSTLGGIFVKRDQGAWVKLHNSSPDSLATGNLDDQ